MSDFEKDDNAAASAGPSEGFGDGDDPGREDTVRLPGADEGASSAAAGREDTIRLPGSHDTPASAAAAAPGPYPSPYQPQRQQPPWAASHAYPPPGYAGGSGDPARRDQPTRARVPGWLWPVVCSIALVLGLVGGALGGVALQTWQDRNDDGRVSEGLSGVDTVSAPPLEESNGSVAAVAQTLLPSTVQIVADLDGEQSGATGSGFVLDRQGHIVTNNHVVAGAADSGKIEVIDHNGIRYTATIVGRSPVYDLAVLEIEGDADALEPASLGQSNALRVGEAVVAIGSPLGLSSTVTSGIVSALNRPVTTGDSANESSYINAVQTDAAINPGNSGGPLVNLQGQVVGVNSAIATTGGMLGGDSGNIGVGFAIPVEQVRITADQILRDGEAYYPVIGAKVQTGGRNRTTGATIDEVLADTPAEKAGLRKGDVITRVEEQRITDGIALIVAIRTHQPGETVEFTLERDGEEQQVEVTLGSEVG
ncbi:S1C family serine protease [Nocardioides sp.]|uniref:S1C family serine protease n=1 Tax=Nocardioides sp. TaxID=35761 RepID=UPI002732F9C6|nr:trypsin-like peptidase domain-containing protein [Nocardioides sp.]MDP3891708.1 trypsin-like peptidase domain-containing protein [Nocardioides sp.]